MAIVVRSTDDALRFHGQQLGLRIRSSEVIEFRHIRLTYLDVANAFLQLVEPLDGDSGRRLEMPPGRYWQLGAEAIRLGAL